MEHQPFADDSQLHRSCQPSDIDQTILSVQDCVSDIRDGMTDKLLLDEDRTEAMLFSSSKLQDAPASVYICQSTVTFPNSVRNLVFYMDKNLSMKQYINFTCKTAFFELHQISTIRQYLTVDATKTLVVSLVLSWIDYCNSLLASLPLSLISKLQRVQNCAACSSCIPKCTYHTNTHSAPLATCPSSYLVQNCLPQFQFH